MASRQAESEELAKRVESVGWEVSNSSKGYRVKAPNGMVIVIHKTYGDRTSLDIVKRRLDAVGLTAAEEKLANRQEKVRTVRTAKAQAAAFSDAEDINKRNEEMNAVRLAKAAGPYQGPEDVHITWFAQPHPKPWMRWVVMTPEIAAYLIREHNTSNRPVRPGRVKHYKNIILRGEWHLTHQGMAMDSDGVLQDGQHRLQALVDAAEEKPGIKVPVPFFVGMDPRNFLAIDEGANRSAMDLFARGGESYGSAIAAIIRLSIAYQAQSPRNMIRERLTNEAVVTYFGEDADEIRICAKISQNNAKKAYTASGPLGAAMYVIRKACGPDNRYVEAFLSGLLNGTKHGTRVKLDDDDPRHVVREHFKNSKFAGKRIRGIEAMSIIVQAWNNVVENRRPRYVRFTDDTPIPKVTIALDDGSSIATYAAPKVLVGEIEDAADVAA